MDENKDAHAQETEQNSTYLLQQQFQLFAQSQTSEHLYILFNSANHPQLPQQYYALNPEQQYTGLLLEILEGYNEQSILIMPYLVKINKDAIEDNPFILWLFSTVETRESFFALSSDFDLNTVAAHWDSIALAYSSQQQTVILRLFDGRIGKQFFPKLSQSEQDSLMGPSHTLWIPDETDGPLLIKNTTVSSQTQSAPWFHLTQQHEAWLASNDTSSLRYNVSLYLWENHEQTLSQYSEETIEQITNLGLNKVQSLGFTLTTTICQCFSLMLEFSPVFYRHKAIQNLWEQPASEQEQLARLSEKITPQQWQQIAQQSVMDDWLDIPESPIAMKPQT